MVEPTTVTAVNAMEKSGFVRRSRDATDRRKVNVFLTPAGRALQSRLLPHAKAVNELAAAGLSAQEVATLRAILDRVRANLRSSHGE